MRFRFSSYVRAISIGCEKNTGYVTAFFSQPRVENLSVARLVPGKNFLFQLVRFFTCNFRLPLIELFLYSKTGHLFVFPTQNFFWPSSVDFSFSTRKTFQFLTNSSWWIQFSKESENTIQNNYRIRHGRGFVLWMAEIHRGPKCPAIQSWTISSFFRRYSM